MNSLIALFGIIMSAVGMGTSTISQVQDMRMAQQQQAAAQQAQSQVYQQCGYGTQPQLQQLPDGSYRVQCIPQQAAVR